MLRPLAALLLLSSAALADAADGEALKGMTWDQIVEEARGGTVNWFMWGGADNINAYVSGYMADRLKSEYDITLNRVPITDAAEIVNLILSEKEAGITDAGTVDLIWINGENFRSMKDAGLAFCGYTGLLPNDALVNWDNPAIANDFGVPVDGCEVPWNTVQFAFAHDSATLAEPPQDMAALLDWIKANPGRFTYPKPPQFHGSSFLKQILLELTADPAPLYREASDADFARLTAPLWGWLDQLHPLLWRKGKLFPTSAAETKQLLDDGELAMAISFNPGEAQSSVQNGTLPPAVRAVAMSKGALTNSHFLAIPFNASARAGAKVVADFLLSPTAQARKADPAFWGDPSVLRQDALPGNRQPALRFKAVAEPHPSWQTRLEAAWAERYGH